MKVVNKDILIKIIDGKGNSSDKADQILSLFSIDRAKELNVLSNEINELFDNVSINRY